MATLNPPQGSAPQGRLSLNFERTFRVPDSGRWGPGRRRLLFRTAWTAIAAIALGLVLIFAVDTPLATSVGLSLIVPGGGFLYSAWPILFVVTWAAMWVSWNLWIGFGTFFHVLGVYLLALVGSALVAEGPRPGVAADTTWEWAIPALLIGAALYVASHLVRAEAGWRRGLRERERRNAYLDSIAPEVKERVVTSFTDREQVVAGERPITDADAAMAKWLLKISMQPVDKFDGWDNGVGPFQAGALRYQVNGVGNSLAYFQANYVPAYPSLYGQAQRNVIEKAQDIRAWGYWFGENFFGNLKLNPDPIKGGKWDNIMFGAFFALQVAHYEATNQDDHRYDQPGAFRFVWRDGRVFSYSLKDIVEYASEAHMNSPLTLYPCEPNQIYMVCNQRGAAGVQAYDYMHGTDYWHRMAQRWTKALDDEFMMHNGDYYGHANGRLGMNVGGLGWNDGTSPMFMNGNGALVGIGRTMAPEVSARLFFLEGNAERWDRLPLEDDVLRLPPAPKPLKAKHALDFGYWRKKVPSLNHLLSGAWVDVTEGSGWQPSNAAGYAGIADTARMYGNPRLAEAAIRGLDEECFLGMDAERPFMDRLGTLASIAKARFTTQYGLDDVILNRIPKYEGPLLASAPYPEVLVTRAKGSDGVLELTMEPTEESGRFPLKFERLLPNREYFIDGDGARFTTDHNGLGEAEVSLTKRVFLTVRPV